MVLNLAVFGAFVLMVAVLGFFLWQTLFVTKEYGNAEKTSETPYTEQQTSGADTTSRAPPSSKQSTDEAVAEYTKWLAIFTLFLVLATIGLFISGERNVEVARMSANAAKTSAKVAEDTLIAGDRPWVGPETIDFPALMVGGAFQATIRWRNTGHSPALNSRIYTESKTVNRGEAEPGRLTIFPAEVDTTLMMPNEVGVTLIFHNSRINNQAAIDAIKNGEIVLWLLGLAEYSDIYGRMHTTVFRERYDPDVGAYRSIDGTAN